MDRRLEVASAVGFSFQRCRSRLHIPRRSQRIGGRIQKLQECVHPACKVTDGQVGTAWSRILILSSDRKPEDIRAWINRIQFLDEGPEIGKVLDALALELLFPLHGSDDLANELRQPGSRMSLVN